MKEKDELAERYFAIIQKMIKENENVNTCKSTQDTQ